MAPPLYKTIRQDRVIDALNCLFILFIFLVFRASPHPIIKRLIFRDMVKHLRGTPSNNIFSIHMNSKIEPKTTGLKDLNPFNLKQHLVGIIHTLY